MIVFASRTNLQIEQELVKSMAPNSKQHDEIMSFINTQIKCLYSNKKGIPNEISQGIIDHKICSCLSNLYFYTEFTRKADKLDKNIEKLDTKLSKSKDSTEQKTLKTKKEDEEKKEKETRDKANKFGFLFRQLNTAISVVLGTKYPNPSVDEKKAIENIYNKLCEYDGILQDIQVPHRTIVQNEKVKADLAILSAETQKENNALQPTPAPVTADNFEIFFQIEEPPVGDGGFIWTLPPKK